MKIIHGMAVITAIALVIASVILIEPLLSRNGTSVLAATPKNNKRGGTPFSVKMPDGMTTKQHKLLNFAYAVAKEDGYKEPKFLQGIIMQETKAGGMTSFRVSGLENRVGDRYFGIGQIKLAAAKEVMNKYPAMWKYLDTKTDEELQARLIIDDEFNIRVASKYALIMGINQDPLKAVTAYNLGPGGAQGVNPNNHHYTIKVQGYALTVNTRQGT